MSDFLDGLLRRSRAPVPEAVRPLPRALFEPDVPRGIAPEQAPPGEAVDGPGRSLRSLPVGEGGEEARRRSRPAAAPAPSRSEPERSATPGAPPLAVGRREPRAGGEQPRSAVPVVEAQRTVMIPPPAAGPVQHPTPAAAGSRAGDGDIPGAATTGPRPPRGQPGAAGPGSRSGSASLAPAPVPAPASFEGAADPEIPPARVTPRPLPAAPETVQAGARTAPGAQDEHRPPGRRAGPVEIPPLRPARSPGDLPRGDSPGHPVRQAAADEPPVVRVTIGRVEVRAVSPPARPVAPPAPRPRQPSLSLGDYLAQRGEGRR